MAASLLLWQLQYTTCAPLPHLGVYICAIQFISILSLWYCVAAKAVCLCCVAVYFPVVFVSQRHVVRIFHQLRQMLASCVSSFACEYMLYIFCLATNYISSVKKLVSVSCSCFNLQQLNSMHHQHLMSRRRNSKRRLYSIKKRNKLGVVVD